MTARPAERMADPALEALRHALPGDTERGPHAYAVDGAEPRIAFAPSDRTEVAVLLKTAAANGLAVAPQAGRTALALGQPLARYDVALDLRGLHRTVEYVPDDLTVTVEAGMSLRVLQQELAEHGQHLPVDPAPDDHATVGGLLATARSGAWRGHLPAARDLLLGIEVALPSGELVKSGGRVVKNVTGYDLHRMHTGALGAFGVIVDATFKVAPLPASTAAVAASVEGVPDAAALAHRVWDANLAARAITLLTPEAAAHVGLASRPAVFVDLAGSAAAVDRSREDLVALARFEPAAPEGWAYLRRLHGDQAATVLRIGVPPTALPDLIEAARRLGALAWGHLAAGAVIAHSDRFDADVVELLRRTAESRGGFLQVESAPIEVRRNLAATPGDAMLVGALRDRFDPSRTINPGRWGEGL